jgi:hypothetical protein
MNTSGLTAEAHGGEIHLYDNNGNLWGKIHAPDMSDAAGAHSGSIGVSLSGGDGSYTLKYVPSDAWLSAPERVYPVVVDPTV